MQKQRRDAIEMLSKIPNVEIVGGEDMIETEEQSLKILERFEKDRPDMLVALFTTSKCLSCCGRLKNPILRAAAFRLIHSARRI